LSNFSAGVYLTNFTQKNLKLKKRNKLKKRYLVLPVLILSMVIPLFSQEVHHKWQRMAGIWEVKNSHAFETQGKAIDWNYYELLNLNSILSLKPFSNYTSIDLVMNITERIESPAEVMISFNITSESQSWFYHLYAFKLTGGYWGMNKAALIYSDRADKSKPFTSKNNIFVKELASVDCKIKFDKAYNYRVAFEGENIVLYINEDKILSAPFPEKNHDGRIAVSSRNTKIAVDKIAVKKGSQVIFEDDFNNDTIYVKVLKVQKIPAADMNKSGKNKP